VEGFDPEEAKSIRECQELFSNSFLRPDLAFIKANLSFLPKAICQLEKAGLPLTSAVKIVQEAKAKVDSIPGPKGKVFKEKFASFLQKCWKEIDDTCQLCLEEEETSDHLMWDCPALAYWREAAEMNKMYLRHMHQAIAREARLHGSMLEEGGDIDEGEEAQGPTPGPQVPALEQPAAQHPELPVSTPTPQSTRKSCVSCAVN
jgi:hypothetical protein